MTNAPHTFDARAILGETTFSVRLTNVWGTKVLHYLTQKEVNRLISSWADLLDATTDRVQFYVWEEV